jgi:uncharacterized membrane protein
VTTATRTTIIVLSVFLLLSVCLNMFIAGAVFTGRFMERRVEAAVARTMQAYPPELRRDVKRRLIAERGKLIPAVIALRQARQRMFVIMRADELDKEALAESMTDVREKTAVVLALLQGALADSLAAAPASERQKIEAPGLGLGLFGGRGP